MPTAQRTIRLQHRQSTTWPHQHPMRNCQALIDSAALQHNFSVLQQRSGAARVVAVIKADAYGHGMLTAAQALTDAAMLAVATMDEALQLRHVGNRRPLLVLQGFKDAEELLQFSSLKLIPVLHASHQVSLLSQSGLSLPQAWLKLQTGMHRLGLAADDFRAAHARLGQQIDDIVLMSHFACAEDARSDATAAQLQLFDRVCADLQGSQSLANSAALWEHPGTRRDWVRPGIMLYGVSPFAARSGRDLGLRPVMRLHSELIAIQHCRRGDRVGYGLRFACQRDTRIGVVAIGYGDGYPRHAADGTPVLVDGAPATLAGMPSMDMLTVDLGPDSRAQVGAPVELWGDTIAVETVARHAGTIPYELLCQLTSRVPLRVI